MTVLVLYTVNVLFFWCELIFEINDLIRLGNKLDPKHVSNRSLIK